MIRSEDCLFRPSTVGLFLVAIMLGLGGCVVNRAPYIRLPTTIGANAATVIEECPSTERTRSSWHGFVSGQYKQFVLLVHNPSGYGTSRIGDARKAWEAFARQGHPYAKYIVGRACMDGTVYRKDEARAVRWFQSAMDTNVRIRRDVVRRETTYSGPVAITKNIVRPNSYKEDEGAYLALYALGRAYLDGTGVESDEQKGFSFLKRASRKVVAAFDDLEDMKRRRSIGLSPAR